MGKFHKEFLWRKYLTSNMECPPSDQDMKYLTSMDLYKNPKREILPCRPVAFDLDPFFWALILFLILIIPCCFTSVETLNKSGLGLVWWQTDIFPQICWVFLHGTKWKWNRIPFIFRGMGQLGPPLMGTTMSAMMAGVMFFNIIISSTVDAAAMMTAPQRLESSWESKLKRLGIRL